MAKVVPSKDEPAKVVDLFEKYEQEIVKKRHNCTDIICLILFLVFCLAQLVLSILIYIQPGDPRSLLLPHDSDGNICADSTPNLFYFNLLECISATTLVTGCTSVTKCVSSCPSSVYFYMIQSHRDYMIQNYCVRSTLSAWYNGNIPSSVTLSDYVQLMQSRICPAYTVPSSPIYARCLPSFISTISNSIINATDSTTNTQYSLTDMSGSVVTDKALSSGTEYIMKLINLKGIAQFMLEDFYSSWALIVLLLLTAAVASFIYIMIMRWILAPIIYLSMIGLIGTLGFGVYFCIQKYITLNSSSSSTFSFSTEINSYLSLSITWLVFGIIIGIILIIILLVLLVVIKRLRFAIQIICEASKAVSGVFLTLLFPIIPLLLQLGFLAYFCINAVLLATAGSAIFKVANSTNSAVSVGQSCTSGASTSGVVCVFYKYGFDTGSATNSVISFLNTYQYVPQLFNLFMLFWIQAFIVGFGQMVLAGSFGIWYWSKNKSHCIFFTSLKDTIVYHMGSIAFGSLLIAICKFLRFIIEMVEKRLKKAVGNKSKCVSCLITFVSCCCKCCLWCLEKFLKFINRNAYIMVAIYGSNFCVSAFAAVRLLLSNPLKALILDGVSFFLLLLGRILITAGVGVLAFYFFTNSFVIHPLFTKYFAPTLHYYWLPLITVILGAFYIAKIFLAVFEMAVDTVFLCALKDLEIHDGTPEKPYYMSTKLLSIMNKKNKPAKAEPESPAKSSTADEKVQDA